MAKKILVGGLTNNIPVANSGLKLSKNILLEKIEPHPKFKILFNIEEELKDRISTDMNDNGYDASQPVHIWVQIDEDDVTHYYLIDGYTRVEAAKKAGLKTIPYFEHKFDTFEEAHRYVLHLQVDRRNLDSNTLLLNLKELMGSDYIQNIDGKKSNALAKELGVGARTIEKALSVEKNATEEQKDRIEKGEASINQIYNENHPKKTITEKVDDKNADESSFEDDIEEDFTDSLSDNTGVPSGLNVSHTDGIERPVIKPTDESDIDSWTIEKNKQVETARIEGFARGFEAAFIFVLAEIKKGRTPEEVFNDDRVADLSPSVISKFILPSEDEDIVGDFKI